MKAILLIDIADDVVEAYEDFIVDYDVYGTPKEDNSYIKNIKYDEGARIRPLPQTRDEHCLCDNWELESIINAESRGFNKCLEEIINEKEKVL